MVLGNSHAQKYTLRALRGVQPHTHGLERTHASLRGHTVRAWNTSPFSCRTKVFHASEPLACWYAAGYGVATSISNTTLSLRWDLPLALWNSARLPGQCVTLTHRGRLVHTTPVVATTDRSVLTCVVPSTFACTVGSVLSYNLRPRNPSALISGPVWRAGSRAVLLQGSLSAIPMPYKALLHLGGWESAAPHPQFVAALDPPAVARANIYAIESVDVQTDAVALRSALMQPTSQRWVQLSDHLALGSLAFSSAHPAVPTGWSHHWPYPADQQGVAWLLTTSNSIDDDVHRLPEAVWFVRAADVTIDDGVGSVDGVTLVDGDRVLLLGSDDGLPREVREWNATTGAFDPSHLVPSTPESTLWVVQPGGAQHGGKAHCWGSTPFRFTVHGPRSHTVGETVDDVLLTDVSTVMCRHAFLLLVRESTGLYAPQPVATACNLYTTGTAWSYPVVTADGTDRWYPAGLTDGLIVSGRRDLIPSIEVFFILGSFHWLLFFFLARWGSKRSPKGWLGLSTVSCYGTKPQACWAPPPQRGRT